MSPPRAEGWFAEDLDRLPEAPRHTELIDGALVFILSPQRSWRGRLVTMLTVALMEQAPADTRVGRDMTVRLGQRNRPEPDLLVTTADSGGDRTWFAPDEVRLIIAHSYAPTDILRGALKRPLPFENSMDLDKPTPPRSN
ncbi:Uma2 family endonuclease [Streptomyces lydicus]|uniref:Uma2 family endonuclease n=1 Tax=Streptomyces lydicus TaxID=47763 RepID=UPI0037BBA756